MQKSWKWQLEAKHFNREVSETKLFEGRKFVINKRDSWRGTETDIDRRWRATEMGMCDHISALKERSQQKALFYSASIVFVIIFFLIFSICVLDTQWAMLR